MDDLDNNIFCFEVARYLDFESVLNMFHVNRKYSMVICRNDAIFSRYVTRHTEDYHCNGALKFEYDLVDGVRHGQFSSWDINGNPWKDIDYWFDKIHGHSIEWRDIDDEGEWVDGEWVEGKWVDCNHDDRDYATESDYCYKNGVKDGPYIIWFADHTIRETGYYRNGKKVCSNTLLG